MFDDNDPRAERNRTIELHADERSASNVLSIILLIGMVVAGATVVLLVGSDTLQTLETGINSEAQEKNLREVDSKVSSLAFDDHDGRATLRFGDIGSDSAWVDDFGSLNVTINRRHECSANVSFRSIRYEDRDGRLKAYEMGGIWHQQGNGTVMASPPTLRYENGTITVSVFNFSGSIDSETEQVYKNATRSEQRTRQIRETLTQDRCSPPDNVTITLRSDFYAAWYEYLDGEVDATSVTKYDSNRSVVVFMNQSRLPPYTNQSHNRQVNLTGASYVNVSAHQNSFTVTKNSSVEYMVAMQPLAKGVQIGDLRNYDAKTLYRPPLDVVFVIDESGSMDDDGPSGVKKYRSARWSMYNFTAELNGTRDRAGLVGFYDPAPKNAEIYRPEGYYLTSDFAELNDSIDDTKYSGGTHANAGLREGLSIMDLRSNSSREKVMILLSDGNNDNQDVWINGQEYTLDEATKYWARKAAENGITVYTVGFGSGADETLLREVANETGGQYYFASNSSDLNQAFEDIAATVTQTRALARPAASMNVTAGSSTFYPQIDGEPGYVANASGALNINDPTAPQFSITFAVQDGQNMTMNALSYECDGWAATNQAVENETTGETFTVVRCTDVNESSEQRVPPDDVAIYHDGDDVAPLLNEANANDTFWQADLRNETLVPYLETGSTRLDLASNQAIVVFDYDDPNVGNNRVVVLLEVGRSEEAVAQQGVVLVTVSHVTITED
ncbi:MAG: vWA domain-containing protein [Halobacteriales archaeon]